MFADLPVDPAERAERQLQQERNELVKLRDRLRPRAVGGRLATGELVCYGSGAFCLVACGLLAIALFIVIANDGGAIILAILQPSAANGTLSFNFTFNETNSSR